MNTKPLLLSATILALLTACGGSGGDTQTVPEQPQTPLSPGGTPPPSPTPPPPPGTIPPPPPSPPPSDPPMKPVPDYAQNMSLGDQHIALRGKAVKFEPFLSAIETELKNGNMDSARHQYLHIEWPTPSDIAGMEPHSYVMRPFSNPHTQPAKWHDGKWEKSYKLKTSALIPVFDATKKTKTIKQSADVRAYEQYYSVLERTHNWETRAWDDTDTLLTEISFTTPVFKAYGIKTAAVDWPTAGMATYRGIAMDHSNNKGSLSYSVDFGTKKGEGKITDLLPGKTINLLTAQKVGDALAGNVRVDNKDAYPDPKGGAPLTGIKYGVDFYGPHAEEIIGTIEDPGTRDQLAGFAGQLQELKP